MSTQGTQSSLLTRLFDLRLIIAVLFAIFGLVVTIMGLVAKAPTISASGQNAEVNVNLWTGIPMLIVAVLFALWALLRPVQFETPATEDAEDSGTQS